MECESSSRTTLSQSASWSGGDASNCFTSQLGAQGHANSHPHTHLPSNHLRKPHPHSSNNVTLPQNHPPPRVQAPVPLSVGTNIQSVGVVLPQVQNQSNQNVQPGYIYTTNTQLDGGGGVTASSGSISVASGGVSGFALTGHPTPFKSTAPSAATAVNYPPQGGVANSGQIQYGYTIAQTNANQGQPSSQTSKSGGEESPMVGVCVQNSVASHWQLVYNIRISF